MKLPIKILLIIIFAFLISGCTGSYNSYLIANQKYHDTITKSHYSYTDYLLKQTKEKQTEIGQRLIEVEQAYKNKEIDKSAYLNLKNNLIRESDNEQRNFEQKLHYESQQYQNQLNQN